MTIQALSGTMTLAGGRITSAAMDYANALSPTDQLAVASGATRTVRHCAPRCGLRECADA
jgi:hypothetical protein